MSETVYKLVSTIVDVATELVPTYNSRDRDWTHTNGKKYHTRTGAHNDGPDDQFLSKGPNALICLTFTATDIVVNLASTVVKTVTGSLSRRQTLFLLVMLTDAHVRANFASMATDIKLKLASTNWNLRMVRRVSTIIKVMTWIVPTVVIKAVVGLASMTVNVRFRPVPYVYIWHLRPNQGSCVRSPDRGQTHTLLWAIITISCHAQLARSLPRTGSSRPSSTSYLDLLPLSLCLS